MTRQGERESADVDELVPGHRLLPHERWHARWLLRRRQSSPAMLESKFNQNYGPEGLVLMGAAMATAMPGGIIAFVGLALLVVSRTEGALGVVAYCTVGIGMVAMALSMIRFQQAAEAGKRFRGDRPMQTGPGSH